MLLLEYYESGNAPHEALGRAARRLAQGGALYLGGGVGIEKQRGKDQAETFRVTQGTGISKDHPGPLSAAIHAFTLAGASGSPDTPGGAAKVSDPAAAARLRELADEEAEAKRDIERYTRQIARRIARQGNGTGLPLFSPSRVDDDAWEERRVDELKANLQSIAKERKKLLATGKIEEVEQARPGTNFTKVPAANVKKLSGIVEHYKGMAHGFTQCVKDQVKHGLSDDHAKRRCAVVTDLGAGTTKWRKGGQKPKKLSEAVERVLAEAIDRLEAIEEALYPGASVVLAEGTFAGDLAHLSEGAAADYGILALAGHPLAEMVMFESFGPANSPNATSDAVRAGGKRPKKPARSPSVSSFDETKHKRGARGTTSGGKFVSSSSGSSTQVRTIQHKLGVATDGHFGSTTVSAVKAYQQRHGLKVDGIVGRQTLAAMAGKKNAAAIKPGALSTADRTELHKIRSSQTRRRAATPRTSGGRLV